MNYKLLTPGPLTTTDTVKQEMLSDYSTWDSDYLAITQSIRADLLALAGVDEPEYTSVLMQGSGTFSVESVLSSVIGHDEKVLICDNGAYGKRMGQICQLNNIPYILYQVADHEIIHPKGVEEALTANPDITHVAMVHSETTTGILNDIQAVGQIIKEAGKTFIVDAMSSFGGIEIPMSDWDIDFLISSSNKCIQGVPGFAFVIAKTDLLEAAQGKARSVSLNLYDQWATMKDTGKWRFTSPTHTVLAFRKALDELKAEGGLQVRARRYRENNDLLNSEMAALGFESYLTAEHQGPFISTFLPVEGKALDFSELYDYTKARGYVIYPGKLTNRESFRIGNIGEIYPQDILNVTSIIGEYMQMKNPVETKLVIFDWAGTTVDFGCLAPVEAFRNAFASKQIEVTEDEIRQPMGMSKIDHVRTMLEMPRISQHFEEKHGHPFTEEDVQAIYRVSEEALLDTVGQNSTPKPDTLEAVKHLREMGVKIGSTTGYTSEMMDIVTVKAKEAGYEADYVVTSEDTSKMGRPYPYMIFKNMEHFGIETADQVLKVGDTLADIAEGKNAKVVTVGVVDGSSEMGLTLSDFEALTDQEKNILRDKVGKAFLEAGADYVVNNLMDLLEHIK